jgi:phage shock protein B
MDPNEAGVACTALLMVPVVMWFAYRIEREKTKRGAAGFPDPAQHQMMWETAQRMERRMESLESLLDSELPGWRSRSNLR